MDYEKDLDGYDDWLRVAIAAKGVIEEIINRQQGAIPEPRYGDIAGAQVEAYRDIRIYFNHCRRERSRMVEFRRTLRDVHMMKREAARNPARYSSYILERGGDIEIVIAEGMAYSNALGMFDVFLGSHFPELHEGDSSV